MKPTRSFRKGLIEKTNVLQTRSIIFSSKPRKMLVIALLITSIFCSASWAQKRPVSLPKYDSCYRTAEQGAIGMKSLSAVSPMVRVAYVVPSNRVSQPNAVANLQHVVKLGQQWFKEQMEQIGFGQKTYRVETDADGVTPLIHVVNVPETDEYLRGDIWGRTMVAASNAGITVWAPGEVWLIIPEAHLMLPDGSVIGGIAGGASSGTGDSPGVAMISSNALFLFQPNAINDDTPYDGKVLPALGPFPMKQDVTFSWFEGSTFSSLASTWIGALWHEVGHAFGLPHDFRNDDNFHGNLMGNGLRGTRGSLFPEKYPQDYTRLEYASALILNVSHYFNENKSVTSIPVLSYSNPGSLTPQDGHVRIAFEASDGDSLSVAYLGYRGEMVAEMELDGTKVDTAFVVPYFRQGELNPYDFSVYDKQGNKTFRPVEFFVPGGYNQAPIPFIRIEPPIPGINQPILLDGTRSQDDQSLSTVIAAWDIDNDGQFDMGPDIDKTASYLYENAGNYLIRLKLIDASGAQTISTAVSIKIPGEKKVAVESFTLINADKDAAVVTLKQGMEISFLAWEDKTFSIRANTSVGVTDRVEFDLKGPIIHQQTDNEQPYALFGDSPQGNFTGRKLLPGEYTLTATPFSPSGKGIARTISFKVIDKSIPGQATVVVDKTIGGTGMEYMGSAIATSDGGYLLAGNSTSDASGDKSENSRGFGDFWIVKVDAEYDKLWDRTFGGDYVEELRTVIPANDGGYLLGGFSASTLSGDKSENSRGEYDYWVVKIDEQGNKVWDKSFGGAGLDLLFQIVSLPGGGYLLAGSSESNISGDKSQNGFGERDYWIVKIDNHGDKIWDKTFGGSGHDELKEITATADGHWLLGGPSSSNISGDKSENSRGSTDYWLIKIDDQGNKKWDKTIGGSDSDNLDAAIMLTGDGGYLLFGGSISNASGDKSENGNGSWDYWVVKTDGVGNKLWDKSLGGNGIDGVTSVIETPDGGYLLGGFSNSDVSGDKSENGYDYGEYWVIKIDATGNKVWDKTIGGTGSENLSSVILALDGDYVLTGTSDSNISGDKTENSKGGCDENGRFCFADYWLVELKAPRLPTLPIVTSFTLMNAHTSKEIKELNSGDSIRLREVGNILLDIRANITATKLTKVTFDLTGPITHHQTETVAPYALFGDIQGDFNGRKLLPGAYNLTVTAYNSDTEKTSRIISFTVIDRITPVVASLTLMNAYTSQEIKELKNADVINLTEAGRLLDIRANVAGDQINKVTFDLRGPVRHQQTELVAPYALFGDIQGDFNGRNLSPGAYSLTVTAYASDTEKSFKTVSFTVIDRIVPTVASLTLMNANTSQEIKELNDGDVIRLTEVGDGLLDVRANLTQRANKVTFDLSGPITFHQTETVTPYALFGDIQGDFNGRKLLPGQYTLTVTPYGNDGSGTAHTITFAVTREATEAGRLQVEVYPIPASNVINIKHEGEMKTAHISLMDFNGNELLHQPLSQQSVEQLDVSKFKKGIHYLKVLSPEGLQIIRLVIE